ncbi:rhombosortase [Marinobacter zhejiangensis]|uniref:Rhomboid family GlyGly-CTERM serine protease n=1 Tax=Marinobacter zhejiangensis TaxID=488535 RepID=A0A1I4Q944_9GAMM|nr:rhombosortase [Marinobacter zhejiangensis]SFM36120.1 rhomboid family GlyGly-CTERM serine protease [Marinobacter zhejiangensis]
MSPLLYRSSAPLLLSALMLACWLYPVGSLFQYQPGLIGQGEYWRLLTGHWVHIDRWHLMVNLVGVWLVWWWTGKAFGPWQWWLTTLVCSLAVSVGLYFFDPTVAWYRGFSGVLFGLFAAGTVVLFPDHPVLALAGLVGGAAKLTLDALGWEALGVGLVSDFRVIHQAHLYGFVSGLLLGAGFLLTHRGGS